jgi:C4-dicarboxylate transporter DctM subunit
MLLLIILLLLLLALGAPIYIALALPALITLAVNGVEPLVFAQRMFGGIDKFALMAIPLFIFAATLMGKGGMAQRILVLADVLVGRFYGGTAVGTVLSCLFFGALSGSSPATVVAVGGITYPMLLGNNYGKKFSMGLVTSASSLALLIPPSITMIVYASSTGTSVGRLFMAGVGPGIVLAIGFILYSVWYSYKYNIRITSEITGRQMWHAFKDASWALGVPVIILGGIYAGIFTPTESASVAAAYAIIIGLFVYKELDLKTLFETCKSSALLTGQVMILCASAAVLSWMLSLSQAQLLFTDVLEPFLGSPTIVLIIMVIILIIFGMFIDPTPFVLLLAPLFAPIANMIGLDLIHLGIIMVAGGAIGMFTPPFGLNLFVGMATFREDFASVAMSCIPFIVIGIIFLFIIAFAPDITMWLPNRLW